MQRSLGLFVSELLYVNVDTQELVTFWIKNMDSDHVHLSTGCGDPERPVVWLV